jgi:hypothetical protein
VSKADKTLARMRNNPRDWTLADLKSLGARYGLDWRQPGTSHVTFSSSKGHHLTVPAHKPIKPVYVMRFIALLDLMEASYGD